MPALHPAGPVVVPESDGQQPHNFLSAPPAAILRGLEEQQ